MRAKDGDETDPFEAGTSTFDSWFTGTGGGDGVIGIFFPFKSLVTYSLNPSTYKKNIRMIDPNALKNVTQDYSNY